MMMETVLSRSVRLICAGGVALGMQAAYAQEAPMQKVEVTGSRIPTANLEGTSPVTVLSSKDIKADGVRNVESLLNNLPQVFAAQTGNVVNGATGTATVDLRGLGANRTLVLVNGHRMPSGSAGTVAADLNQIPAPLIKRVEVLTGGAGAVYGADAVAGVVNFIMNESFEGVQVELNGSGYQHKQHNPSGVGDIVSAREATNPSQFHRPGNVSGLDGKSKDISLLMGSNFADNKGNATLFFSYKKEDALLQSQRDFTACSLSVSKAGFACGGSSTAATGRIINTLTNKAYTAGDTAGNPRAYATATDAYNFGPINYLQRPDERYGVSASMHYNINDNVRAYANFSMHDDKSDAQVAPGGMFGDVYTVKYDNPLLTQAWRTALSLNKPGDSTDVTIQRRNVEGGGRDSLFSNTSFRSLFGIKGEVGHWSYDVFAQTAKVRAAGSQNNYFSKDHTKKAMDVVNVDGKAVCASVVSGADPKCVPYNPWRIGGVTAEQLAYIQTPGESFGHTSQQIQGANIAADLGDFGYKLPTAQSGIGVSFGAERRVEEMELNPDGPSQNFDLDGSGGPVSPVKGRYVVKDVFGEVRVPLIEKAAMADLLAANVSFRHTSIDTGVSANTYGIGLEWAPVQQVRLRGSYQKAVRAPNIIELFSPQGNNLFDMDADPCAGATPTASAAACARTGVSAERYGKILENPTTQYNYFTGGNPAVKPETSKSKTLGIVLQPMRNLSFTVDYYDINVKGTINNVSPETILNKCMETGDALYCSLIKRDRLGTLYLLSEGKITAVTTNLGSLNTTGIDFGANYGMKLPNGMGSMGFALNGSYLKKYAVEELPGDGGYDCVGLYNGAGKCGQPRPKWRHKARVNWNTPYNVDVAVTWRYFGGAKIESTSDNKLLNDPGSVFAAESEFGTRNYIDLSANWSITKKMSLSGGINNLFDKDPPLTSRYGTGQGNGNTFPSLYDAMGRKLFLNLTTKF